MMKRYPFMTVTGTGPQNEANFKPKDSYMTKNFAINKLGQWYTDLNI